MHLRNAFIFLSPFSPVGLVNAQGVTDLFSDILYEQEIQQEPEQEEKEVGLDHSFFMSTKHYQDIIASDSKCCDSLPILNYPKTGIASNKNVFFEDFSYLDLAAPHAPTPIFRDANNQNWRSGNTEESCDSSLASLSDENKDEEHDRDARTNVPEPNTSTHLINKG